MKFTTPLAVVRGTGSAHEGASHWWGQRISALAMVPLSLWFVSNLIKISRAGEGAFAKWLASPYAALFTAFLITAVFYHAFQGIRVITEDYIKCKTSQLGLIMFAKGVCFVAAAGSIMAIIKLHLS